MRVEVRVVSLVGSEEKVMLPGLEGLPPRAAVQQIVTIYFVSHFHLAAAAGPGVIGHALVGRHAS